MMHWSFGTFTAKYGNTYTLGTGNAVKTVETVNQVVKATPKKHIKE